jgi:hypothetical protein
MLGGIVMPMHISSGPITQATSRRRRLAAASIDALGAMLAVAAGTAVAVGWLMSRTDLGRTDAGSGDAVAAASLIGAALPAWAAWTALRVKREGATTGQRMAGLAVSTDARTGSWLPVLRLAIHPLALPVWGWFAITALLSSLPWFWAPPVIAGLAVAVAGLASFALLLVRPGARAIHDRVARTALTAATDEQ